MSGYRRNWLRPDTIKDIKLVISSLLLIGIFVGVILSHLFWLVTPARHDNPFREDIDRYY